MVPRFILTRVKSRPLFSLCWYLCVKPVFLFLFLFFLWCLAEIEGLLSNFFFFLARQLLFWSFGWRKLLLWLYFLFVPFGISDCQLLQHFWIYESKRKHRDSSLCLCLDPKVPIQSAFTLLFSLTFCFIYNVQGF